MPLKTKCVLCQVRLKNERELATCLEFRGGMVCRVCQKYIFEKLNTEW